MVIGKFLKGAAGSMLLGIGAGVGAANVSVPISEARLPVRAIPLGPEPSFIEAADFDSDGDQDFAVLNGDGSLTILVSDGTGMLAPTPDSPRPVLDLLDSLSTQFDRLAAADLNSDGHADIVLGTSGSVKALLGDGQGGFETLVTQVPEVEGEDLQEVGLADFDGDGIPDFAGVAESRVVVLPGTGDGTFQPGEWPDLLVDRVNRSKVEAGDLDGDGYPDLVVFGRERESGEFVGKIHLLRGDGEGSFSPGPGSPITLDNWPEYLRIADLDNDGNPDLAVQRRIEDLFVRINDGTGGFPDASPVPDAFGGQRLEVADVDGDDNPDLVQARGRVLLGDGQGGFERTSDGSATGNDLALADLDNDGAIDALASAPLGNQVSVALGDGRGGFFRGSDTLVRFTTEPAGIGTGDLNGDGRADLAVRRGAIRRIDAWLSRPDGTFSPFVKGVPDLSQREEGFVSPGSGDPVIGDFDGDGLGDLAFRGDGFLGIAFNSEVENLRFLRSFEHSPEGEVQGLARADLNGDEVDDLVAAYRDPPGVSLLVADGDQGFEVTENPLPVEDLTAMETGDFNGDGITDLVVAGGFGSSGRPAPVTLFFGEEDALGNLSFTTNDGLGLEVPIRNRPNQFLSTGRLNDGANDALAVGFEGRNVESEHGQDPEIAIIEFQGTGTSLQHDTEVYQFDEIISGIALTDVDGDGLYDLVALSARSGDSEVLLNTGDAGDRFGEPQVLPTGRNPVGLATGNFDGDADTETVIVNLWSEDVSILDQPPDEGQFLAAPGALAGSWFNPARDGEGFEVYPFSENGLFVAWFTYDEAGNQQWYTAFTEDWPGKFGRAVSMPVLRREGARFSNFDPDEIETERWGTLTLTFEDCSKGVAGFSGTNETVGPMTMRIQRVTGLPGGAECVTEASGETLATGSLSGNWFDPTRDGAGFMLDFFEDDSVFLTWFTYDEQGRPQWMVGLSEQWSGFGEPVTMDLLRFAGARFSTFDPEDANSEPWGKATLTVESCTEATIEYDSTIGFGSGFLDLVRLGPVGLPGVECRQ